MQQDRHPRGQSVVYRALVGHGVIVRFTLASPIRLKLNNFRAFLIARLGRRYPVVPATQHFRDALAYLTSSRRRPSRRHGIAAAHAI